MRKLWIRITTGTLMIGMAGVGQYAFAGQEPAGKPTTALPVRPPRGRVEHELQRMRETLNLTDLQVAKLRPILQTRNKRLDDLRADSSMPQGEARAKAAEIRKSARRHIDLVLTPEQREKQKAMRRRRTRAAASKPISYTERNNL